MFDNLPGFQVNTVDGNLRFARNPEAKNIFIAGTAAIGPADQPFQVTDRAAAALLFGFDGTLIRAMEEAAPYCDNLFLFRMGTAPAKVTGLGKDTVTTAVAGYTVTFNG